MSERHSTDLPSRGTRRLSLQATTPGVAGRASCTQIRPPSTVGRQVVCGDQGRFDSWLSVGMLLPCITTDRPFSARALFVPLVRLLI